MTGEASYLFDVGEGAGPSIITDEVNMFYDVPRSKIQIQRDKERGLKIYSLRSIFLSHLHADHLSGLPMLLQVANLWQKRDDSFRFANGNRLEVFLPRMGLESMREFLEMIGVGQPRFDLLLEPLQEGEFYRDGNLTVRALHNTHRLGSSFSFIARGEGRTVGYSGDIRLEDLRRTGLLEDDLDLLVVECAHFTPQNLFEVLADYSLGKVIVNHVHPSLYGKLSWLEELGREALGCQVLAGRDGMEVEV